jgi:hypothetical protein
MPPRIPHKIIDGVEHKRCCRCKEWNILSRFNKCKSKWDNLGVRCITCNRLANKIYSSQPHIKIKKKQYEKEYMSNPKKREKVRTWKKKYNSLDRVKLMKRKYATAHMKDKIAYNRSYRRKRYKIDALYRTSVLLRSRLRDALKKKAKKSNTSNKLLGKNNSSITVHLEKQFSEHMTWENRSKWHVDHRVPCNAFDLSNPLHQRVCFWYKNLQPLWAKDNLEKSDKYKEEDKQQLIKDWIFFHT